MNSLYLIRNFTAVGKSWVTFTVTGKNTDTSVKLSYELGKITFSTGKPKLTPGEVSTFQGF